MKRKILSSIKIYKIDNRFYLQDYERVFEMESQVDCELMQDFLQNLCKGIDTCEINSDELLKTLDNLEKWGFLEETQEADKYILPTKKYPQTAITDNDRDFLKVKSVALAGGASGYFQQELQRQIEPYKIGTEELATASLTLFIKTSEITEGEVLEFNKQFRNSPWLFVDLSIGRYATIGPFIDTPKTACYQCFHQRREINQDAITLHSLQDKHFLQKGETEFFPWQLSLVSNLVLDEILRYFLSSPQTYQKIIYIDMEKIEIWKESLLRYPYCSVCFKEGKKI